ncbi:MAG: thioesterase family protein [Proteobacteria bacterium]|nr:thioesterase family protein [Pseudomonadota bacterium]
MSVSREWIDYNGHMNVGFYGVAFDKASDALLDHLGLGEAYRHRTEASMFIVESHMTYDREVCEGDGLRFETLLLDGDEKRLHMFHAMYNESEGYLAATTELMGLHVDLQARRSAAFPQENRAKIIAMLEEHRGIARPKQCGQVIGIRRQLAG